MGDRVGLPPRRLGMAIEAFPAVAKRDRLLSIGAFARRSPSSIKTLRLYEGSGCSCPQNQPPTGYGQYRGRLPPTGSGLPGGAGSAPTPSPTTCATPSTRSTALRRVLGQGGSCEHGWLVAQLARATGLGGAEPRRWRRTCGQPKPGYSPPIFAPCSRCRDYPAFLSLGAAKLLRVALTSPSARTDRSPLSR